MPALPRFDLSRFSADASRFGAAFPSVAASLGRAVSDPATEHLVGGAYYLAGTVLDKVSDFQANAHELLAQRVAPSLQRPIPSATIVAFESPTAGPIRTTSSTLLESALVDGWPCSFRPIAPRPLMPYVVRDACVRSRSGTPSVVELVLQATGDAPLNVTMGAGLSLYLDGDHEGALGAVHALTTAVVRVEVTSRDWPRAMVCQSPLIQREGLGPDTALAPDPDGPPAPFGVVTEAFLCPHKFRFVRVGGLERCAEAPLTREVRISFFLRSDTALGPIGTQDVRTNCMTVVNLFESAADPVRMAFERGPVAIRISGGPRGAARPYAVQEAWAVAAGRAPQRLADLRRLSATPSTHEAPAMFATSLVRGADQSPELAVAFAATPGSSASTSHFASLQVLATNGPLAERVRAGDLAGSVAIGGTSLRFANLVATSPYVPPPMNASLALRVVRAAAVRGGPRAALEGLRHALYLSVPSWLRSKEIVGSMHQRIESIRSLDVEVARRTTPLGTRLGYGYRLSVDETVFRGAGELDLMSAAICEALTRCAPVNTFVEVSVTGLKTAFRSTYSRSEPS